MRRTLALLGATALAVAGLAGPASASSPGEIEFATVQPDSISPHDQALYDLTSTSGSSESLSGLRVEGCVGPEADAGTENSILFMDQYTATHVAPASPSSFRTADQNFVGSVDVRWEAPTGSFYSTDYFLRLINVSTSAVIDTASNGSPNPDCVNSL